MRKNFYLILIILIGVILALQSCTVKKRLYQPGYHVEWFKPHKEIKLAKGNENIAISENDYAVEQIVENNDIYDQQPVPTIYCDDSESIYASNSETKVISEIVNSQPKVISTTICKNENHETHKNDITKNKPSLKEVKNDDKTIHYAAIIGLVLCILGYGILPFVGLATTLSLQIILAGFSPLFLVIGFLFTIYAKDIIKSNADKYRGMLLVKISLILCIVFFALILIGLIVGL